MVGGCRGGTLLSYICYSIGISPGFELNIDWRTKSRKASYFETYMLSRGLSPLETVASVAVQL